MLFLLVFGMIDFGYAINRYAMVNNAAREGVRAASLMQDEAAVKSAVLASAGDGLGTVDVQLSCRTAANTSCAWNDAASGGTALVKVRYDTKWITPVGSLFSDELSISKTTRMRIE
jgi:Flp pilus assembly protein TadG